MIYDTLTMFPIGEIEETWNWKTDIVESESKEETRYGLIDNPRVTWTASYFYEHDVHHRSIYDYFRKKMLAPVYSPMFQYAALVTQNASIGEFTVYCDMRHSVFYNGMWVTIVDLGSFETRNVVVETVYADRLDLVSSLDVDVNSRFAVVPCMVATFEDPKITLGSTTATVSLTMNSFQEPDFVTGWNTQTIAYYDDIPSLEAVFIPGSDDTLSFDKTILDNGIGVRDFRSSAVETRTGGKREFYVDLMSQPKKLDYWRKFLDKTKGAFGAFWLESQRNDFRKVQKIEMLARQGGTRLIVYEEEFPNNEQERHIRIHYADNTWSDHRFSDATEKDYSYRPGDRIDFQVFSPIYQYFDLWDLPGVDAQTIADGRVQFVSSFEANWPSFNVYMSRTIENYWRGANFGNPYGFSYVTVGGNGTEAEGGNKVEQARLVPAGARYIQFAASVVSAAVGSTANLQGQIITGVIIDGTDFISFPDFYSHKELNLSPALPNDPKVKQITRISSLLKVRMSDTVTVTHGLNKASVSFEYMSTNESDEVVS
jgi:hypothetical protein